MNTSPAKSHEARNTGGHQSRGSLTESENRRMISEGSPVKSRKSSNAEAQRGRGVSDHCRKQSGGSGSPQKKSNTGVANKTTEKSAMPSNLKVVEENADPNVDSTSQPIKTTSETDNSTMKEHNAKAESSSEAAQSTNKDINQSTMSQSGLTENVTPSQTSIPGAGQSALDGVQDTAPSARNRQPSHKTTKSKSSTESPIPEGKVQLTSQGPPIPQNSKSAGKKPIPNNEPKSKKKSATNVNNRNQQDQVKIDTSKPSATVGTSLLPNDKVHSVQAASTVQHSESSRNDASKPSQDPPNFSPRASESSNAFHTTAGSSSHTPKQTEPVTSVTPSSRDQEPTSQAMSRDTTKSADDSVSIASASTAPTSLPRTERSEPTSQAMSRNTAKTSGDSVSPVSTTAPTSLRQNARSDRTKKTVQPSKTNSQLVSMKETKPSMPGIDPDHLQRQLQANAAAPDAIKDHGKALDEGGQANASKPNASNLMQKMAPEAIASNQKAKALVRRVSEKSVGDIKGTNKRAIERR